MLTCVSSGHDAYFYQLFMDKDERVLLPTTQQLLELSFMQSDVKLSEVQSTRSLIQSLICSMNSTD